MAIYGIEGGIGTGKTISLVYFLLQDLRLGKKIYTNIKLKNVNKENVIYLDVEMIQTIFDRIKDKSMIMENSSVYIQEMHNYIDSRMAMSKRNRAISYWILQSRHTGSGSCNIYFDTQDLGQVDLRLRRNTDFVLRPTIIRKKNGLPELILLKVTGKFGHRIKEFAHKIDVFKCLNKYSTHEVVEF